MKKITFLLPASAVMIQVSPGSTCENALALKNKLASDVVIVSSGRFSELILREAAHQP